MNIDALDSLCIAHLQNRGFIVTKAEAWTEWTTPGAIAKQAGLSPSGLWRRLHHKHCPDFEREPAEGKRIHRLRPTPALMRFLTQPKSQGEAMKPAHCVEVSEGTPRPFPND